MLLEEFVGGGRPDDDKIKKESKQTTFARHSVCVSSAAVIMGIKPATQLSMDELGRENLLRLGKMKK